MALISCHECGKQISDSAQSCPNCGAPVKAPQKKKFCKYCGSQIMNGATFCPSCGKPQTSAPSQQPPQPYVVQQPMQPQQMAYQPQQFAAMGMQPFFMPCAMHPQSPAVATCGHCGKSMCKECVDSSEYNLDGKPLCRECNLHLMNENIAESESTRTWSIVKLVFLLICVLVGYIAWQGDTGDGNGHIWGWIIAGFGGLPSAMKTFFHRSAAESAVADAHIRVDPENGCLQEVMWFVLALVFSFAFAPVAAVWFIIKNISKIVSNTNFLKKERPLRDNLMLELQGA